MFNKIAIFAVGAIISAFVSAASAQTCALTKLATYDFAITPHGDLLVQVNIDGVMEPMLLDPNEEQTTVMERVREDVNVRADNLSSGLIKRMRSVRGGIALNTITIPNLFIGTTRVKNVKALLITYGNIFGRNPFGQAEGVLGMDVLHNFDLEFDLGHGKVNVFSPDHCAGQGLYWAHSAAVLPLEFDEGNKFRIPMVLDGKTISVGLAADPGHFWMPGPSVKEIFGIDENTSGAKVISADNHGSAIALRYPFQKLSAGDFAVANPVIDIMTQKHERDCAGQGQYNNYYTTCRQPDLLLTEDILGRLRLYFAVKEKKVYITGFNATLDDAPVQGSTQ